MLHEPPAATPMAFTIFGGYRFLSLITFQKNGQPVTTPVRFAQDDGKLYVRCAETDPIVERIHANAQVEVAPCDEHGEINGHAVEAMAVVLLSDRAAAARRTFGTPNMRERLHDWVDILRGLHSVCLEITPM